MAGMEFRRLGKTGLQVSVLSYGSWVTFQEQIDTEQVKEIMSTVRAAGVNLFDCAEAYAQGQAEVLLGDSIKALGWKRSDYVLTTKIFWGGPGPNDKGLSRKHVIEGTKASLQRLGHEYVDLLFAHRADPSTPMEETCRAFNWCIDHGLAMYWGTSEWSLEQIEEARSVCERLDLIPPAFEQPQYNLLERTKVETEFAPLYDTNTGLGLTTWSPLAFGVLSGKYSGGAVPEGSRLSLDKYKHMRDKALSPEGLAQIEAADNLKPIAEELGATPAQLAIAWCAKNPHVSSVILGATKLSQAIENVRALEFLPKLTPDICARIEQATAKALEAKAAAAAKA